MNKKTFNSFLPLILFLFAALVWRTSYYVLSLYVAIPLLILFCFYNYKNVIIKSRYFSLYLFIIIWMFGSSILNPNTEESLRLMIPIVATFLVSMSVYAITRLNRNASILFLVYVLLFAFLMIMNVQSSGFTTDFNYSNELERRGNSVLNANEYAYYSLFAIIAWRIYFLMKEVSLNSFILLGLYLLSASVSFFVALMIASRQVLVLQIPILLFFFYLDFVKGNRNKSFAVILAIIIIVATPFVIHQYDNSYLAIRSEVGFQEDARSALMINAIEEAMDNPIFGIGLGANAHFSHSTYTHLLSRSGIPTLIAFIVIMGKCILDQWRRYFRLKRSRFLLYWGCLIIIAIGNFTYSYLSDPFLMPIMFAIIGCSETDYQRIKKGII